MSVPPTAGNFASGVTDATERANTVCYIATNLPKQPAASACVVRRPQTNDESYRGGNSSGAYLDSQLQALATCNYQRQLALAQARGQVPGSALLRCPPSQYVPIQTGSGPGFFPPGRCTTPQEYANVGVPVSVPTCYNLVGITQKKIN